MLVPQMIICTLQIKFSISESNGENNCGLWPVDRLVRGLFLNYLFSRFSSCGLRSQEVISVVLFLETLVLCLLFSNFKKASNQR